MTGSLTGISDYLLRARSKAFFLSETKIPLDAPNSGYSFPPNSFNYYCDVTSSLSLPPSQLYPLARPADFFFKLFSERR